MGDAAANTSYRVWLLGDEVGLNAKGYQDGTKKVGMVECPKAGKGKEEKTGSLHSGLSQRTAETATGGKLTDKKGGSPAFR